MKVLIAEDEFTTRMMVQVCLEEWGYRVVAANDGTAALAALEKSDPPQIAILDWEMPELDGIEVCRLAKEKADGGGEPYVILLTARDSRTDILRGFDAGADDYMTKPFNDDELRARVRVAERLVRSQASLAETVAELKEALNQLEVIEGRLLVCAGCQKVYSPAEDRWRSLAEAVSEGGDPRLVVHSCPDCRSTPSSPRELPGSSDGG